MQNSTFDSSAESLPVADHAACPHRLDRRAFLRDSALAVVAALAVTGFTPGDAFAKTVSLITPLSATARERTYGIPTADGVSVDEAQRLALVRFRGRMYAFSVECPHKGRMLEWRADEGRFFCPKHKARFGEDGVHVSGRRTSDLDRYALRRDGTSVTVSLDRVLEQATDAKAWAAAVVSI
jgi:nitrite reductase/ring-hydroxylating ferredoxin subunit